MAATLTCTIQHLMPLKPDASSYAKLILRSHQTILNTRRVLQTVIQQPGHMDQPFDPARWIPTQIPVPWDKTYSTDEITTLIARLNHDTFTLVRCPYDPNLWVARASTLLELRYTELAVGDAHKAELLCIQLLKDLDLKSRHYRIGRRMGFWMEDPESKDSDLDEERECQQLYYAHLQSKAYKLITENLCYFPIEQGRFIPAPYPWLKEEHTFRSDEQLEMINRELADPANGASAIDFPNCVARRYAFGPGIGARKGADLLGLFAARDMAVNETILVDESHIWGCNGPGRDGSDNLFGGTGCNDPLHPETEGDDTTFDLRWIRDRCGREAANAIQRARLLLCCVQAGVSHPLDYHLAARLAPVYPVGKQKEFHLLDISIANTALQQMGIDIFANHSYDTWVLFALAQRLDNNNWSDPNTACLNSLFSLLNHSCEPNCSWASGPDHRTLTIVAQRPIAKDEQLFVEYDSFMRDQPLAARRRRLWRWLDGPCQCTRCVREEMDEGRMDSPLSQSFPSSHGDWDTEERPRFPKDDELPQEEVSETQW